MRFVKNIDPSIPEWNDSIMEAQKDLTTVEV